jgi:Flp pilus assembly protein protease CpaA
MSSELQKRILITLAILFAVTPFFAYREIGGGRIRLMAPARDLMRAQQYLAEIDKEVEPYN